MDPWSALSAAASVLQVLDFGARLLSEAVHAYKSLDGHTLKHAAIELIASELSTLSNQAQQGAKCLPAPTPGSADATFLRLCRECEDIATELHESLAELKRKGVTKWDFAKSSFRAALKTVWPDKRVKALIDKLEETQNRMVLPALMYLWLSRDPQIFNLVHR